MDNFNNVNNVKLRNFNRAVMAFNLMEDAGPEATREYLSQFTDDEKSLIFVIIEATKKFGVKHVMGAVTKDIEFENVSDLENA